MALWWAQCKGWDVTHLVSVIITGDDSMMFQIPGVELVEHQAELIDAQWIRVESSGKEEVEIQDLENALKPLNIDGIVAGALRSDYQKSRLERMAQRLGLKSFTPLWHQDSSSHLHGLVENGFQVMITGVSSEGIDEKWLGHILKVESLQELQRLAAKFRFHVDGEGGEYETLVVAGPHMKGRLNLDYETHWDGIRGHIIINQVRTQP